jgi:hypothetical protein
MEYFHNVNFFDTPCIRGSAHKHGCRRIFTDKKKKDHDFSQLFIRHRLEAPTFGIRVKGL